MYKVAILVLFLYNLHNVEVKLWFILLAQQVFGMDKQYWFIPAYSEEDIRRMPALQGLEYPSKPDFDSQES